MSRLRDIQKHLSILHNKGRISTCPNEIIRTLSSNEIQSQFNIFKSESEIMTTAVVTYMHDPRNYPFYYVIILRPGIEAH
jgi:hypothetical protein